MNNLDELNLSKFAGWTSWALLSPPRGKLTHRCWHLHLQMGSKLEVTLRRQSQPCCVLARIENTLSTAKTWPGDFAARESIPCAIPKPLTW